MGVFKTPRFFAFALPSQGTKATFVFTTYSDASGELAAYVVRASSARGGAYILYQAHPRTAHGGNEDDAFFH